MLLEGVTILEVGNGVPVAYCGRVLASLGALVIKVEGADQLDPVRDYGAPCPDHGTACSWCHLNGAKVRLATAPGQAETVLTRLVDACDFAIAGDGGIAEELEGQLAPSASLVRIVPAVDAQLSVPVGPDESAGVATGLRDPYGQPVPPAGKRMDISEVNAGAHAAAVVGLALASRAMGNDEPVRVRVGIYDASLSMIEIAVQTRLLADMFGDAQSDIIANRLGDPFVCRDGGLIGINLYGKDVWARMCDVMDTPELKDDERFIETVSRWSNGPALREILDRWCISVDRDDAMAKLRKHLIPAAPIISCTELLTQDQVIQRGIIASDDGHTSGTVGSLYVINGERPPLSYMTPAAMVGKIANLGIPDLNAVEVEGRDYVSAELR